MRYRQGGFTLTEILVTIGILAIVMTLLIVPLISSLGYVKMAAALADAKQSATQAMVRVQDDLSAASVIYDPPPTGEAITFRKETGDDGSQDAPGMVTLGRYAQLLTFPYEQKNGSWQLLYPNYWWDTTVDREDHRYAPFYLNSREGMEPNPYTLAFYSETCTADQAAAKSWDYRYPMDDTSTFPLSLLTNRTLLERALRNTYQSVTPYGNTWDLSHFSVTPTRVSNETMAPLTDANGVVTPTVCLAKNALWGGRNRIFDDWVECAGAKNPAGNPLYTMDDTAITTIYNSNSFALAPGEAATITNQLYTQHVAASTPFAIGLRNMTNSLYCVDSNPFGFKIQVYGHPVDPNTHQIDTSTVRLVYGSVVTNSTNYTFRHERHFMDWPPLERQDFYTTIAGNQYALWTQADITRQRDQGKLAFAQPMAPAAIDATQTGGLSLPTGWDTTGTYTQTILPAPPGWDANNPDPNYSAPMVWLATAPRQISLQNAGKTETFKYIKYTATMTKLAANQFTLPNLGAYDNSSRLVIFGTFSNGTQVAGAAVPISYPAPQSNNTIQPLYSICDLQPDDTITATYSTKGMLDVSLTASHQSSAATSPEASRQDYTINKRIEAKNAVKRVIDQR